MVTMDGWATTGAPRRSLEDKVGTSLVERAKKREVAAKQGVGGSFLVVGDKRLGDSYPSYTVVEDGAYHRCSCQTHAGGRYRKTCSHILAVVLWKREHDWKVRPGETHQDAPGEEPETRAGEVVNTSSIAAPAPAAVPRVSRLGDETAAPTRVPVDPRDPAWGDPGLPGWITELRPHQVQAVGEVVEAFERGAKVVFLDAPTGSGKTLIGECVRRLVGGGQSLYTCSTLTLQDQFLDDFDYAKVVKGRRNYATEMGPVEATCDDCPGGLDDCPFCEVNCPYLVARDRAVGSRLGVLNTAYMLTIWNKGRGQFLDRDLVIVDECDLLEGAVMGYAEVRVHEGAMLRYRLPYPKKKTVRASWIEWVREVRPMLTTRAQQIRGNDLRSLREKKRLVRLVGDLSVLMVGLMDEDSKWVYAPEGKAVVFKPVTVDQLGMGLLWGRGKRFLVMSASIISAGQMADDLGLEDEWDLVTVPSTFDPGNRPIHVCNVGSMSAKAKEGTLPRMKEAVRKIVDGHPGERVLVHTVSYALAKEVSDYLTRHLDNRTVVTYVGGTGRQAALTEYLETDGAVLVAPSMDRGVDLPGDKCRVQVICKVPYPYLGDEQVKARLYGTRGGESWYAVQTVRTMVQMTGRGVRSASDRATTYILDGAFVKLWKQWERLFPEWWREAVAWDGHRKRELGL